MTLSSRIVLSFCLLVACLIGGFFASGRVVLDRVESALLSLNAANATATAQAVLAGNEKPLMAHGRVISREREALAALAAGDTAVLDQTLSSTFNRIAAAGEVSDLRVYDIDLALRADFTTAPTPQAGAAPPALVTEVAESGRRAFAITRLDDRRYGAAYAIPLLQGRNRIGYAFLALDVASNLERIAETTGGSVILANLTSGEAPTVDGVAQSLAPGELDANATPENETPPPDPERMTALAVEAIAGASGGFGVVQSDGAAHVVTRYRLGETTAGDRRDLYLFADFTDEQAEQIAAIRSAVAGLGIFALVFLSALLIWLRFQMRPLKAITSAMRELSQGEDVEAEHHRRAAREIADLGAAMNVFIDQAKALKEETRRAEAQAREIAEQAREIDQQSAQAAKLRAAEDARAAEAARVAEDTRRREQAAAAEISAVVEACARGDFSDRLRTDDKEGVFLEICEQVNGIGEAASAGLEAVRDGLRALEARDLSHRLPADFPGVFGEIAASMNATSTSLAETLADISVSAREVDATSREMSKVTDDLARRSEHNAQTLQQTAAALAEMTATVGAVAAASEDARHSADDISRRAADGYNLVSDTVAAMERLRGTRHWPLAGRIP